MEKRKPIIGILGGIGSGKSSVAAAFARLGCGLVDADAIVHELLQEADTIKQLREAFGDGIMRGDGVVDREKLALAVFDDVDRVKTINEIIHPAVLGRCEELITGYNACEDISAIVLDMPLLLEVGWDKRCNILVFVACDAEKRQLRGEVRSSNAKNYLKKREKFQISLDKKENIAHYIVDNNSDESAIADQVERIFSIIINN
ncbi:MAG: dephospho-CoA kinase [Planctomycetes bacterium]|nr:dephospho-CoA kinase [Planctomycetota bacterium]